MSIALTCRRQTCRVVLGNRQHAVASDGDGDNTVGVAFACLRVRGSSFRYCAAVEMLAAARRACASLHNARRNIELAHNAIVGASEDAVEEQLVLLCIKTELRLQDKHLPPAMASALIVLL